MAKMADLAKKSWEGWDGFFGEMAYLVSMANMANICQSLNKKFKWHAKEPFESGKYGKNSSKPFNYKSNKMVNYKLLK